jgi:hypothetical protein
MVSLLVLSEVEGSNHQKDVRISKFALVKRHPLPYSPVILTLPWKGKNLVGWCNLTHLFASNTLHNYEIKSFVLSFDSFPRKLKISFINIP